MFGTRTQSQGLSLGWKTDLDLSKAKMQIWGTHGHKVLWCISMLGCCLPPLLMTTLVGWWWSNWLLYFPGHHHVFVSFWHILQFFLSLSLSVKLYMELLSYQWPRPFCPQTYPVAPTSGWSSHGKEASGCWEWPHMVCLGCMCWPRTVPLEH